MGTWADDRRRDHGIDNYCRRYIAVSLGGISLAVLLLFCGILLCMK